MKILFSFLLLLAGLTMKAQQSPVAAGGNATGSGGTVSFSVGQIVYTTNSRSSGSVAQGVQQPFEISTVIEPGNSNINLEIVVYPNPATEFVTLNINNYDLTRFSYQLFDAGGKLIENRRIATVSEIIKLGHLPSAVYFLKVTNHNQAIKTFKIIKN